MLIQISKLHSYSVKYSVKYDSYVQYKICLISERFIGGQLKVFPRHVLYNCEHFGYTCLHYLE